MKLSIIIPVYNVEKYLEACLLSCVKQDIPISDYEIIVVNDGSPDNSFAIAGRMAKEYSNIRVISQENLGLSGARNTGIKHAIGEYIWFVDSDDVIRENCLGAVMKQCFNNKLDLLAIAAADVIDGKEVRRFHHTYTGVMNGKELLVKGSVSHCAPFTICHREFLLKHNFLFYPGIYHEDSEWSPRIYFHAQRVGFTDDVLYLVTINPNSITRTVNFKKAFDCLKVAISIDRFFSEEARGECADFFHTYIGMILNSGLCNFLENKSRTRDSKMYKAADDFEREIAVNTHLFMHLRKSSIRKYRLEGWLFTLFPRWTVKIYLVLSKLK